MNTPCADALCTFLRLWSQTPPSAWAVTPHAVICIETFLTPLGQPAPSHPSTSITFLTLLRLWQSTLGCLLTRTFSSLISRLPHPNWTPLAVCELAPLSAWAPSSFSTGIPSCAHSPRSDAHLAQPHLKAFRLNCLGRKWKGTKKSKKKSWFIKFALQTMQWGRNCEMRKTLLDDLKK